MYHTTQSVAGPYLYNHHWTVYPSRSQEKLYHWWIQF